MTGGGYYKVMEEITKSDDGETVTVVKRTIEKPLPIQQATPNFSNLCFGVCPVPVIPCAIIIPMTSVVRQAPHCYYPFFPLN